MVSDGSILNNSSYRR